MQLLNHFTEDIKEFVHWAHQVAEMDLVKCSSGNLSFKIDSDKLLISATRSWLGTLTENEVALQCISDGVIISEVKPSGENPLHRAIYQSRPEIKTILHFQSPAATTLACIDKSIDYNVIIEVPIYIGKIATVPYIQPGSQQLANAVAECARKADIIQLMNHGQVVCGNSYKDVLQKAVFFELACTIIINSNFNARPLKLKDLELLRDYRK